MKTTILFAAILMASPGPAPVDAAKSPLLANWEALLASGCHMTLGHVHTPIEARVLRNLPYARAGHVFKSPELTALFSADGGWYAPSPTAVMMFDPKVGACIQTLKRHERALRKVMPWPRRWEAKYTADHSAVVHLRQSTKGDFGPVTRAVKSGDGSEAWWIGGADCKGKPWTDEAPCWVYQLYCSDGTGTMQCGVNAPG
jgi:hypothetical protein